MTTTLHHLGARAAAVAICLVTATAVAQPERASRGPALLKRNHDSETIGYRLTIRPGAPEPGTTVTIDIALAQMLAKADPTYGTRKPIDDATLEVVLVGPTAAPAKKKKKKKHNKAAAKAPYLDVRTAFKLSDSGSYSVTFTAPDAGVYGLHLRGTAGAAGAADWSTTFSYGVWPIPEDAPLPAIPVSGLPAATLGNLGHGKALCTKLCKKDLPDGLPAGTTPIFLNSDFGASLSDAKLLTAVVGDAVTSLSQIEKNDLAYYLHSLHVQVDELFPEGTAHLVGKFTIDADGRERLDETAHIKLTDAEATGTVFVVYGGEHPAQLPRLVDLSDRVARDMLEPKSRLGYVVFFELPGEKHAKELGIALGPEPIYPIVKMIARDAASHRNPSFNKKLEGFTKLGKFNDKKSLSRGPRGLRDELLPIYLRAAELATMYYKDEREFTAFDNAFD